MSNRILEIQQSSTEEQSLAAYKAETENGICWYYCISQDELYLLVKDHASPIELTAQLESDSPSDVDRYDAETGKMNIIENGVDITALFAYYMENADEKFECWENDGGEGLGEAAESDNGIYYVLSYKLWENINYYYQYLYDISDDEDINIIEAVCNQFIEEVPEIDAFDMENWLSEHC